MKAIHEPRKPPLRFRGRFHELRDVLKSVLFKALSYRGLCKLRHNLFTKYNYTKYNRFLQVIFISLAKIQQKADFPCFFYRLFVKYTQKNYDKR